MIKTQWQSLKTALFKKGIRDWTLNISLPFYSKDDPSKALTWAYITAFGLIATLTVVSHMATTYITDQQKESAEISHYISSQRGIARQIALYASNYYRMEEQLDHDFLMRSISDMEAAHDYLMKIIPKNNTGEPPVSLVLLDIYHEEPFKLAPQVEQFLSTAKVYASLPAHEKSKPRSATLNYLSTQSSGLLLQLLDTALERYQTETIHKIARYYNMQFIGTIFILGTLLFEAAFVFRPLVIHIRSYHDLLLKQALEDPLTGLDNRRAFIKRAEMEIKQATRLDLSFVVVLADLDNFKLVNDTYGHDVGDKVLQHFSKVLKKSLRAADVIGRIGGEEFALLLPQNITAEKGRHVLERLCEKVAHTPCEYNLPDGSTEALNYTVSIGYVFVSDDKEQPIEALLKRADEALYKAKDQGRNCVVSA